MSGESQLRPGAVFAGDFEIVEPLGEGGMGALYVARQRSTGALRALKLMQPELVRSPGMREKFEQEARIGARIDSDHVAQVLAAGVDPGTGAPWIAMELLRGETLAFRVERSGPLAWAEVVAIFAQMGHALGRAHRQGIVHRDLKPENVFLAAPRVVGVALMVKLLDFGIAKVVAESQTTQTGVIGTPAYMAPEQYQGRGISPATDVWALGLIAFYLLTGKSYWRNATGSTSGPASLMYETCMDPLVAASTRAAELGAAQRLPPGFDAWFARCVAREPQDRFGTVDDALASMRALGAAQAAGRTPPTGTIAGAPAAGLWTPPDAPPETERSNAPPVTTSSVPQVWPAAPAALPPSYAHVPTKPRRPRSATPLILAALAALVVLAGSVAMIVARVSDDGAGGSPPVLPVGPRGPVKVVESPPVVAPPHPTPPSEAPAPGPGSRRSPVPSMADWNVVGEVTVTGSSALACETKMIREWLRVTCRGTNDTGGTPLDVTVQGKPADTYTFAANQVTSLVLPFVEGVNLEAVFSWTDKRAKLHVAWPRGAPMPAVKGRFVAL